MHLSFWLCSFFSANKKSALLHAAVSRMSRRGMQPSSSSSLVHNEGGIPPAFPLPRSGHIPPLGWEFAKQRASLAKVVGIPVNALERKANAQGNYW